MKRSVAVALAITALGVAATAAWWSLPGAAPPPNILFVMWDTARADRMSLYGHTENTTPRLDAFAKEAVVYENATAPGMWTLASHAAMFTGLHETSHGAKPGNRWLDERFDTLADLLSGNGYDTFAFSANLITAPMTNLTQGFGTVHTAFPQQGDDGGRYAKASRQATRKKVIPRDASTEISPAFAGSASDKWGKSVYKDAAPVAHTALTDWLAERTEPDRPFFAYINMMEAHTPRVPSLEARKRISDEATIERALATDVSLFAENEYIVGVRDYSPEQLAAISEVYDAALVDLDEATGDLLDDLRNRGLLENTVVVLASDHGEGLGEHRRFEHRWSMFEQLLHVPLIVRYPDGVGARVTERVNTIDLFATLLDVASVTQPAGTHGTSLRGRATFDRFVYAQMLDPFASQLRSVRLAYPDLDLSPWTRTYCVAYEGSKKLLYASDDHHALYDVVADPGELADLHGASAPQVATLEQALVDFEAGLAVYDPSLRAPGEGARDQTDEEAAMLKLLGYADDDGGAGAGDEAPGPLRDHCGPTRAAAGR